MNDNPLFPQPIPILGITGHIGSGKTMFMLRSCEPEQILVIDHEKSSVTYQEQIGFNRIDVSDIMFTKYGNKYPEMQIYLSLVEFIESLQPKQYKLIMIDPFNEIEESFHRYVSANPQLFNYTANQFNAMAGVKWGCVKQLIKRFLMLITQKCECFCFVNHLGEKFLKDGTGTGIMQPKGKNTLMEKATLYLELGRDENISFIPKARVLKSRLSMIPKDRTKPIIPLLPQNSIIENCTYDSIVQRMLNPEQFTDKIELPSEPPLLSDDERLILSVKLANINNEKTEEIEEETEQTKEVEEIQTETVVKEQIPKEPTLLDQLRNLACNGANWSLSDCLKTTLKQLPLMTEISSAINHPHYKNALNVIESGQIDSFDEQTLLSMFKAFEQAVFDYEVFKNNEIKEKTEHQEEPKEDILDEALNSKPTKTDNLNIEEAKEILQFDNKKAMWYDDMNLDPEIGATYRISDLRKKAKSSGWTIEQVDDEIRKVTGNYYKELTLLEAKYIKHHLAKSLFLTKTKE